MKPIRTRVLALVAVAGCALAAACSGTTALAAADPTHATALARITVTMDGKSIMVGGILRSGGADIVSAVRHEQAGEPIFVRLDPGVTLAQFFNVVKNNGDPNNLDGIASIVVDTQANRGTSTVQAYLLPGQYVALDAGNQNSSPANWPRTTFVVARSSSPAAVPRAQATIAAIEFGFQAPASLHDGELVGFANHGFLVHMIFAFQAKSRADASQIISLLKAGKDQQAQGLAAELYGFAGPLSRGSYQQLTITQAPGYWVLACFMNTQDGREHTQLGMERIIQITK